MLRRFSTADVVFAAVVLTFTALAARVWWLADIVPGQDYPQFLVFVRAVEDGADPTSPFHGTYVTGPWFTPTGLPVHLTVLLSHLCGHSIESAGKLLLTLQNVGLTLASVHLLKTLGRSRWAVVLLFPLIHSVWTVVGGFAAYSTALPLVVLGWALTVRWLDRFDARSGIALAACLCATLLWHGIAYSQLGLAFAVLWSLWRAPSLGARLVGAVPALPSLVQYAAWMRGTFAEKSTGSMAAWLTPWQAADSMLDFVWADVPHHVARALLLAMLIGAGLVVSATNRGPAGSTARMWRFGNPFLVVSLAYLAGYFLLPIHLNGVAGFSNRFPYLAALAFIFAWNLPRERAARGVVATAVLGFSAWCLDDIAERFRDFQAETRGASDLMNRIGPRETMYYFPEDYGFSPAFRASSKPKIELQQYAAIRHGGLPNSSFAGYGYTYVRFGSRGNPMPGLSGPPVWSPQMARFDYVLVRSSALSDPRFRLIESRESWALYGVCGSPRFPTCT